jgi:hypothetical protein
MTINNKLLYPLFFLFIGIGAVIFALQSYLPKWGIDSNVLHVSNLLFLVLSVVVFFLQSKAMANANPNVFVRSVMGGVMIKMLFCVLAIILYRIFMGATFSKMSVFVAMFFYLFYLAVEVSILLRLNKKKNG